VIKVHSITTRAGGSNGAHLRECLSAKEAGVDVGHSVLTSFGCWSHH